MNATTRFGGGRAMRGFTLIELMVTVVIIGILAAIAYPSYLNQIRQTRRTEGKATLLDTAQRLERCFTRYSSYNAGDCDVATDLTDGDGITTPEGWYVITNTNVGAGTFTLLATAQLDQTKDTRCGNLSLTHRSVRGATGTQPATCW